MRPYVEQIMTPEERYLMNDGAKQRQVEKLRRRLEAATPSKPARGRWGVGRVSRPNYGLWVFILAGLAFFLWLKQSLNG